MFFASAGTAHTQNDWYERESEHFRVISREGHAHLVPHILNSAETALQRLRELFSYSPSEKIIINTYDVNDYGAGSATSVPHNYIWLDLEPVEPGYEHLPYNERLQWLLSHELVHIVVNDLATNAEERSRSIFSKVPPEQIQPLSVFYSLLTNYGRYTPRWHQEGIAVFLETWLSGGFGRTMGSFDEMYFRSLVAEGKEFPNDIRLETEVPHSSFLVETGYYLFGGRFATYLSLKYGPEKLLEWYTASATDFYVSFTQKFQRVFNMEFDSAWQEFIEAERKFQLENIAKLETSPITELKRLSGKPIGAVSQAHLNAGGDLLYWGEHRPHHLAAIQQFSRSALTSQEITTLPTPSLFQVSSTAYDAAAERLFFTTKNNQLYRDVWMLDVLTGKKRLLFENSRVGPLSVSPSTHDLWGIRHSGGAAVLVLSRFPYDSLQNLIYVDVGTEMQGLSVSPSGELLAATLHMANGDQSIVVTRCDQIKSGRPASYEIISDLGSPENPSWNPDNKTVYWNAYTNGVSNIFKKHVDSSRVEAVTHTRIGLFKPLYVSDDSLFAFEFSTEGFYPVMLSSNLAERLPAIKYLGQQVYEKFPQVGKWVLNPISEPVNPVSTSQTTLYNGFDHLKVVSLLPVITGFQSKKVVGLFAHISDPILNHDLIVETGISPFGEKSQRQEFHLKLKYDYRKEFEFGWDYNAPDFYDLFNARKRSMPGSKIRFGNTHYWIYDNPHKLKQQSEIALYTNVGLINDNRVRVSQSDFFVAQTNINSQSLRRTIGSSDFESGNEYTATTMLFASNPKDPQFGLQLYADFGRFMTVGAQHNVLHVSLAGGYHWKNDRLRQSRFYFGGFGNRALENIAVKQFRKTFRFPGVPIYSLGSDRFAKLLVENNFPPIRFANAALGQHFLNHVDASLFSQVLVSNHKQWLGIDVGIQANLVIKHWFNLESTLSAGVARAWLQGTPSDEWFISYKLLKN